MARHRARGINSDFIVILIIVLVVIWVISGATRPATGYKPMAQKRIQSWLTGRRLLRLTGRLSLRLRPWTAQLEQQVRGDPEDQPPESRGQTQKAHARSGNQKGDQRRLTII